MSRGKLTARDKRTQKMSRDGLVERNNTTGEDIRISNREADYSIQGDKLERQTLSQVGTRFDSTPNNNKKIAKRHSKPLRETEKPQQQNDLVQKNDIPLQQTDTVKTETIINTEQKNIAPLQNTPDIQRHQSAATSSVNPRDPPNQTDDASKMKGNTQYELSVNTSPHKKADESTTVFEDKTTHAVPSDKPNGTSKLKTEKNTVYQEHQSTIIRHEPDSDVSPLKHQSEKLIFSESKTEQSVPKQKNSKHTKRKKSKYNQNHPSVIQHEPQKNDSTHTNIKETTQSTDAAVIQKNNKSKLKNKRETVLRYNQLEQNTDSRTPTLEMPIADAPPNNTQVAVNTAQPEGAQLSDSADIPINRRSAPSNNQQNPVIRQRRKGKFNQNRNTVYQHNKPPVMQYKQQKSDSQLTQKQEIGAKVETKQSVDIPQILVDRPHKPSKLPDNSAEQSKTQHTLVADEQNVVELSITITETPSADDTASDGIAAKPNTHDNPDSSLKHDKSGKLKFTEDETAPEKPDKTPNRKLKKAEHQAERAGEKLEKAKNKLPAKRKLRSERVFDEQKGKPKRKLHFEKEVKTQGQHLKGALPLRPIKAGANTLMLKAHSKLYQVEHENVSVKAAHRIEMLGESGVRSALRHHKTAPYRKVTKLEKQAAKKTIKLNYQKALADNPKLSSNMLSRMWQKRKIKKDYAKAAREAKKTAQRAKKAGSYTVKATKAIAQAVYKNPKVIAIIAIIFLLIIIFLSLFSLGSNVGNGGLTAILSSSYLAEDEDIEKAELSYSEWETDLQMRIFNAESNNPGYDEYRYDVGDISHNPYELIAYLTAVYQNFPYDGISSDLQALFDEQYTLTLTPTVETRYRTVIKTDPDTGEDYEELEPYDWNVLTVTLTARSFSDVILSKMTADQQVHYTLLMQTKGNRQYVGNPFDIGWLPYVTSYYGYRIHPITGVKDLHRGVDIAFPAGTEIHSAQDGIVTFAGYNGSYGNVVVIENDKGITTKYAHCNTISVSVGQTVSMGDIIATVGNTGDSTGAHLHFEVMKDGEYLNPAYFADTGNFSLSPSFGTPGAPMGDGSYAALIAEAELHLGKPYVFGSNGTDSFDCSSYICYILTQSGVKNMPRTTAQGIYNQCTPIPASERQPGDLVFFHSTYSTANTVTHVALYVGNGWIIHAGSPVQYTQIDGNSYWTSHLYSYGRLN